MKAATRDEPTARIPSNAWRLRVLGILLSSFLGILPCSFLSAEFTLTQQSDPEEIFSAVPRTGETNATVSTLNPPLHKDGYAFTHWSVAGQRQTSSDGSSRNSLSFPITSNVVAVANYLEEEQDSDADGLPDWYELRNYGSLDEDGASDTDADGFTLAHERKYGLASTIKNEIAQGSVSRRRSHKVTLNLGGANKLTVTSDPPGLVAASESLFDVNSSHVSPAPAQKLAGYGFGYWTRNGRRVADATGAALSQVALDLNETVDLVAKYFPEDQDSDGDGLADWKEWNAFGDLSQNASSDADSDGFSTTDELRYGLNPGIKDEIDQGGLSRRRSKKVFLNLGGAKKLTVKSDPPGFVVRSETNPETNGSYLSPAPVRRLDGYAFAYWMRNGVRATDASGAALEQVGGSLDEDVNLVAKYLPEEQDSDGDGTPDWQEWNAFGNLDNNSTHDGDGDGFLLAHELQYGLHPAIPDLIAQGGVSRRRAKRISMPVANLDQNQSIEDRDGDGLSQAQELVLGLDPDKADTDGDGFSDSLEVSRGSNPNDSSSLANHPPGDILLDNNSTDENLPAGSIVGDFNATDPDANSTHTFALVEGNGSADNGKFTLDANGTLRTAATFDYETNATTLNIRVRATDELNATKEKAFAISVTNVVEDLDGDGIEDFYDTDDDGDGFTDAGEIAYGSDPRDASSVANQPPAALDLNGSTVAENQPQGTLVGRFSATDPDANSTHAFALVEGNGSADNAKFTLNANGNLKTTVVFDYEPLAEQNATSLGIRVRVTDEHNASLAKTFIINIANVVEDLDGDGTEDFYDTDDDGDGFTDAEEIAYGSDPRNASSVANQSPNALDLNGSSVAENQPQGTLVGRFASTDPDANSIHTYAFDEGNGSSHNGSFELDDNGTLTTKTAFDFESNATSLAIRVKVIDEHNASLAKTFVISVANVVEDLDGDGIEDFHDQDDDGDGFTDAVEQAAGTDPNDNESMPNRAPTDILLPEHVILENRPAGTVVGAFSAVDPDDANGTGNYSFVFIDGNGTSNEKFTIDANGTLRAAATFDYEAFEGNATLTIRVVVRDDHNASFVRNGNIVVLDDDSEDTDGDGFSDALEHAAGTDPDHNGSIPNRPPDGITLNNLRIAEGRPAGDLVGMVRASDPDDFNGTGTYELALVEGNGSSGNAFFSLDENGTLRTAAVLDHESNATLAIRLKVADDQNASLEKNFVIEVINLPEPAESPDEQVPDSMPAWLADAQAVGEHAPEWFTSPWFGTFHRTSSSWLYHNELGWVYGLGDGTGNVWLWMKGKGWLWTGNALYPHLFQHERQTWLYFLKRKDGRPYFYSYATEEIE